MVSGRRRTSIHFCSSTTFATTTLRITRPDFRGIPIEELAEQSTFIETAYLLIYGRQPKRPELRRFSELLTENDHFSAAEHREKVKAMAADPTLLAFLHPYYKDKYGAALIGTFSTAVDPKGDKLYVTWNIDRGLTRNWDCCGLTVIHIPESER